MKHLDRWMLSAVLIFVICINAAGMSENRLPEVPEFRARIMDLAGLLKPEEIDNLKDKLQHLETDTTAQLAILTISSLGAEEIEKYSLRVANTWKLGQKGRNNGVLILIAQKERKVRIEVGSGLERILTDKICGGIILSEMTPFFKQGKFYSGLDSAVNAIKRRLRTP
jgi:uncharacterized protein